MGDALRAVGLRTEGRIDPLGVDEPRPRLSWQLKTDQPDAQQVTYSIEAATSPRFGRPELVWETGAVRSPQSVAIAYDGPELVSRQRVYWRVRVGDNRGRTSAWSAPGWWEMGLLRPDDWVARWIRPSDALAPSPSGEEHGGRIVRLRRSLQLPEAPQDARLYVTALGLYELRLNGQRIGDLELEPGWTDYRRRIQYRTFEVRGFLKQGENAIGAVLGDGWYAGRVGWFGRAQYGAAPELLCQLEVRLPRKGLMIASDEAWRARTDPGSTADLLAGQRVDPRDEPSGWDRPGFDDAEWSSVECLGRAYVADVELVAARDDGVRVVGEIAPQGIDQRANDRVIVDFGRNVAGHVRLETAGTTGQVISIRHAEVLDAKGELYTANLRSAEARDAYTFRGSARAAFEPTFTYHGFRYAEVYGLGALDAGRIIAREISSAGSQRGSFECSDELVNAVHRNALQSLRSNFISIPTDCPQRDERLGWTGDVQIFAPSALFLADTAPFLEKWLIDLADAQLPWGAYPDVAPLVGRIGAGNAGWADAGVLVSWAIYEATGDRRVLERQYDSMRRYLDYLDRDSVGGIRAAGLYGDWLCLGPATPSELIGTAYLARSAGVFTEIARLLDEPADVDRFHRLHRTARGAFARAFVDPHGGVLGDTQTGYALGLGFDLVPRPLRSAAAGRLAELILANGTHLDTGFLGTPLVLPVLSETGFHDLACRLARQDMFPSWGYQVRQGATTIWERWNSRLADGSLADPAMNSFNHYAFGSVVDWLHRYVAGLSPAEPGYKRTLIRPQPAGGFTWARSTHDSPYGTHLVGWQQHAEVLRVDLEIPANTIAELRLPPNAAVVSLDGDTWGRDLTAQANGTIVLGSGTHIVESLLDLAPATHVTQPRRD